MNASVGATSDGDERRRRQAQHGRERRLEHALHRARVRVDEPSPKKAVPSYPKSSREVERARSSRDRDGRARRCLAGCRCCSGVVLGGFGRCRSDRPRRRCLRPSSRHLQPRRRSLRTPWRHRRPRPTHRRRSRQRAPRPAPRPRRLPPAACDGTFDVALGLGVLGCVGRRLRPWRRGFRLCIMCRRGSRRLRRALLGAALGGPGRLGHRPARPRPRPTRSSPSARCRPCAGRA